MPMPARALPSAATAMPEARPVSVNRQLPVLWNRKFGIVSFATNTSGHPSSS